MGIHQALILLDLYGQNAEQPPPPPNTVEVTSGLYPVLMEDTVGLGASLQAIDTYIFFANEVIDLVASLPSAPALTVTLAFQSYTNWPIEPINLAASFQGATLTIVISYRNYTDWPVEPIALAAELQATTLTIVIAYITYDKWPADPINLVASLQGVTLA